MTCRDVAARLGVCANTVRNYIARGVLVASRTARGWRDVDPREVERVRRAMRVHLRVRACRFCGMPIPQRRTYCQSASCRRRRQRLRFRAWYARHHGCEA